MFVPSPSSERGTLDVLGRLLPAADMLLKSINVDFFADSRRYHSPCLDRGEEHQQHPETIRLFPGSLSGTLLSGGCHAGWMLSLPLNTPTILIEMDLAVA